MIFNILLIYVIGFILTCSILTICPDQKINDYKGRFIFGSFVGIIWFMIIPMSIIYFSTITVPEYFEQRRKKAINK